MDLKRSSHTITPYTNPWRTITQSLRAFVHKIGERRGIKLTTFIDTNSSFSICTEIALTAADRLILPVSEEHLHRNGFEYLFRYKSKNNFLMKQIFCFLVFFMVFPNRPVFIIIIVTIVSIIEPMKMVLNYLKYT